MKAFYLGHTMTISGCHHLVCLGSIEQSNAVNTQHCEMAVPFHGPSVKKTITVYPWSTVTFQSNLNSISLLREIGAHLGGRGRMKNFAKLALSITTHLFCQISTVCYTLSF